MKSAIIASLFALAAPGVASSLGFASPPPSGASATLQVDWQDVLIESKTTATLQLVAMPPLLEGSNVRAPALESLSMVAEDYVRFVPWFPNPLLAVPEIDPPIITETECTTSWNFTLADQLLGDFLEHTQGKKQIINFSTTPGWMWVFDGEYSYPKDPNGVDYEYNKGTQLRDPSLKEIRDYYKRLLSWYVHGGFEDECGVYHESGHHYDFEYWEVLNEPEAEHTFSPELYNKFYDAVTSAILEVTPHMKFVGLGLASRNETWVEAFANKENHPEGTPPEWISYHWYGTPQVGPTEEQARACFEAADTLMEEVDRMEAAKKKYAPEIRTTMNEIGTMDPSATTQGDPNYVIPIEYWTWSGGVFAYVFSKLILKEIDVVGQSQLYGYGQQHPSVSLVDPDTGAPTARLRSLELIQKSFHSGDRLVKSDTGEASIHAQAFLKPSGEKKVLLVNKENQDAVVSLPEFAGGVAGDYRGRHRRGNMADGPGFWR